MKRFADSQIGIKTQIVTDGLVSYNQRSLEQQPDAMIVQTKAQRRPGEALQGCHRTVSLLKYWLLSTHCGAVRDKHLQANLDEFAFRHNRRKTKGVGRIVARVNEQLVVHKPIPMRTPIDATQRCRWFGSDQPMLN